MKDDEVSRGNPEALAKARSQASARKHRDVIAALARAAMLGTPLTVSTLASDAGVSRQFLYSRPDLIEGLRRHQERHLETDSSPLRASRRADLVNAQDTIKLLKREVKDLSLKLDAGLAAQMELRDEKRLRQLYEQRGSEVNRLISENSDLRRSVTELRAMIRDLEDDLVVERTALRELLAEPDKVTTIFRFAD